MASTLIDHIVQKEFWWCAVQIADLWSWPCILKKHIPEKYQCFITSIDGNKEHFTEDMTDYIVASFDDIPVDSQRFDIVNMSLAFQDTWLLFTKKIYDRIQTLLEMNRILKADGIALIQLPYGHEIKNNEHFEEILEILWFEIYEPVHWIIRSGNNYESNMLALRKIYTPERNFDEIIEQIKYIKDGLKIIQFKKKLTDVRKIISQFTIWWELYDIVLNEYDAWIAAKEKRILIDIKNLISQYWSIKNIPLDVIKEQWYIWFSYKKWKYKIIKVLDNDEWLVEYKD